MSKYSKLKVCCELNAKLLKVQPNITYSFPTIRDWLKKLDQEFPLPEHYLKLARRLRDQLLNNFEPQVLLHGDLHHDNILKDGDEWIIIDPKGVMGYPINEVWTYVIDFEADTKFIAEFFKYDLDKVRGWCFVHLILASCWCLEDKIKPDKFLNLATQAYNLSNFSLSD